MKPPAPLLLLGLAGACAPRGAPPAPPAPATPDGGWSATVHSDHPLVGAIWSVEQGAFIDEATLVGAARQRDYVLLGEKHDNPDHHRLQARLLDQLLHPGGAAVFEMLDEADAAALAAATPTDAAGLAEAAGWAESGWPEFDLYRPVFEAVYRSGARPLAGLPARETLKVAMMEGLSALPGEALDGLALSRTDDAATAEAHAEDIRESHCGYAPESILDGMVLGQRLKDAWMARALQEAGGPAPAVLVAGGGHTRPDRGVPRYLAGESFTVLIAEAPQGGEAADLEGYAGAADVVWFTPRLDDRDPCEVFREQFQRLGPAE